MAEMNLGFRFSERVFCSDAAPGGHGMCYGVAQPEEVRSWCRMAEFRGDYSQLDSALESLVPEPDAPRPNGYVCPWTGCGGTALDGLEVIAT